MRRTPLARCFRHREAAAHRRVTMISGRISVLKLN
jgi:hypothetical protein